MASPSSPPDVQQKALHIYMLGIGLQELFIVIFVVLCIIFQVQLSRRSTFSTNTHWKPLLFVLYFSLAMITVRIIYRLVEFSSGIQNISDLVTKEVYFYILEATPMLLAVLSFALVHPGRVMTNLALEMPGIFTVMKTACTRRKGRQLLSDDSSDSELVGMKGRR